MTDGPPQPPQQEQQQVPGAPPEARRPWLPFGASGQDAAAALELIGDPFSGAGGSGPQVGPPQRPAAQPQLAPAFVRIPTIRPRRRNYTHPLTARTQGWCGGDATYPAPQSHHQQPPAGGSFHAASQPPGGGWPAAAQRGAPGIERRARLAAAAAAAAVADAAGAGGRGSGGGGGAAAVLGLAACSLVPPWER